jgi:hypothetical protein
VRKVISVNEGDDGFEVYSSPAEMEAFFPLAFPISERSYQHRLFDQGLPKTQQFKEDIMEKSANGDVFGYILRIKGEPAAYNLCPIYGSNKALYDYTGYDPRFADYSPGTVLQFKIIEDLFKRERVDYYDLCSGEGIHKEIFATGSIFCGNVYFCFLTPQNVAILLIKNISSMMTNGIKRVLALAGLRNQVKKLIRKLA